MRSALHSIRLWLLLVTLLLTLSAAVHRTLANQHVELLQYTTENRLTLHAMQQIAAEIHLSGKLVKRKEPPQPLLSSLEQSLRELNLHTCTKLIRPNDQQRQATLELSACNFNHLLNLLHQLEKYQIHLIEGNFQSTRKDGKVDATLILGRTA